MVTASVWVVNRCKALSSRIIRERRVPLRHPRKDPPHQLSSPAKGESSRSGTANVLRNALLEISSLGTAPKLEQKGKATEKE